MRGKGNGTPWFALSDATKKENLPTVSQDNLQEELFSSLDTN